MSLNNLTAAIFPDEKTRKKFMYIGMASVMALLLGLLFTVTFLLLGAETTQAVEVVADHETQELLNQFMRKELVYSP